MIKLSDITFVEPVEIPEEAEMVGDFYREVTPSNETIIFVTAILGSSSFQKLISTLSDAIRSGKPVRNSLTEDEVITLETNHKKELDIIKKVVCDFGLNEGIVRSLFMLIAFNYFIDLNSYYYDPIWFYRSLDDWELEYEEQYVINPPCLSFQYKFTKNQLITYINKNWNRIEKHINKLPSTPILNDKFKDIALVDEIFELYEGGKKAREISEILSDKYPDHPHVSGYAWVNNKIKRYKERNEQYSKIFVSKEI